MHFQIPPNENGVYKLIINDNINFNARITNPFSEIIIILVNKTGTKNEPDKKRRIYRSGNQKVCH
jgi:hypothetical protein